MLREVNHRDEEDTDTADEDDLAIETKWIRVKNKRRKTHQSPPEKQGEVRERSSSRMGVKEKKVYPPPPITISGIKEYPVLLGILKEATDKPCKVTALNSDQWKVNISDGDTYQQVSAKLREKEIEWFSYEDKNTRAIKVVARGLHPTCLKEEIVTDLLNQGLKVLDAVNLKKRVVIEENGTKIKTMKDLPLYMLSFNNDGSN
ncbi:hypothetical protein GE061_018999 [Apolygus lucorum]|uniref:Pre-C2HC domain-containing protein n=1 Tax=Apolygus lucorum TaxID=248454 RepID=A0A8S9X9T5_APOLU|nr:hypothetical protein GE061_018999 [Apolygus lucorum]